jgi:uncharacterized protein YlxW (UPF0749 family)
MTKKELENLSPAELAAKVLELQEANKSLTEKVNDLEAVVAEAKLINDELQNQLNAKPEANKLPEVTYKGKTYVITIPSFRTPEGIIKAEELHQHESLVAKLIEKESEILKLKED